MGRFDRDQDSPKTNSEDFGSVTEKLRSTVESQVREVVEEAMARALAIEDRALAKASEVEQESHRKAGEVLKESQDRASVVLDSAISRARAMREATETLETELGKVIASFRDEIDNLTLELSTAKDDLAAPPAAPPVEPPVEAPVAEPVSEAPNLESSPTATEAPLPEPPEQPGPPIEPELPPAASEPPPSPEFAPVPTPAASNSSTPPGSDRAREAVRQQLLRLRETGEPREAAEHYLTRFKNVDYGELLDEIYGSEEPGRRRRRGLLRRG
jgi:hypothetical protein